MSQTDQVWPLADNKIQRQTETSGGETRKEFILVRLTLGRQLTSVPKTLSKVLKILLGSYKKNVGQRWTVMVRLIVILGSVMQSFGV